VQFQGAYDGAGRPIIKEEQPNVPVLRDISKRTEPGGVSNWLRAATLSFFLMLGGTAMFTTLFHLAPGMVQRSGLTAVGLDAIRQDLANIPVVGPQLLQWAETAEFPVQPLFSKERTLLMLGYGSATAVRLGLYAVLPFAGAWQGANVVSGGVGAGAALTFEMASQLVLKNQVAEMKQLRHEGSQAAVTSISNAYEFELQLAEMIEDSEVLSQLYLGFMPKSEEDEMRQSVLALESGISAEGKEAIATEAALVLYQDTVEELELTDDEARVVVKGLLKTQGASMVLANAREKGKLSSEMALKLLSECKTSLYECLAVFENRFEPASLTQQTGLTIADGAYNQQQKDFISMAGLGQDSLRARVLRASFLIEGGHFSYDASQHLEMQAIESVLRPTITLTTIVSDLFYSDPGYQSTLLAIEGARIEPEMQVVCKAVLMSALNTAVYSGDITLYNVMVSKVAGFLTMSNNPEALRSMIEIIQEDDLLKYMVQEEIRKSQKKHFVASVAKSTPYFIAGGYVANKVLGSVANPTSLAAMTLLAYGMGWLENVPEMVVKQLGDSAWSDAFKQLAPQDVLQNLPMSPWQTVVDEIRDEHSTSKQFLISDE
jgi:hypothetical protein